jgi:hypothetical protein
MRICHRSILANAPAVALLLLSLLAAVVCGFEFASP